MNRASCHPERTREGSGFGPRGQILRGLPLRMTALALLTLAPSLRAADKITYADQVRPIFNTNCVSCHNPDKAKAGLDLTSFSSVMAGSSSAKVIEPGDPASSLLYMLITHQAEPHMPLKGNKLPDEQLEIIRKWIEGGALESTSST